MGRHRPLWFRRRNGHASQSVKARSRNSFAEKLSFKKSVAAGEAKQFGVAISTAIGWMKRVDETGSVEPSQIGGYKPKAISGEHAVWLSRRIKDGDFTIRGLVAELAGRGLKVDYHSVWDFVLGAAAPPMDKVSRSRRS